MPDRYLIDSNIFDKLADDAAAFAAVESRVASGTLELLSTHVQRDELAAAPASRADVLRTVPVEEVPTFGFVLGYSRLGEARLGDGGESFEALRRGNMDHTEDALIAETARYEDAVLVTEDKALRKRALVAGIGAIDWHVFRSTLFSN